jgi:hypothetical protein
LLYGRLLLCQYPGINSESPKSGPPSTRLRFADGPGENGSVGFQAK